MTDEPHRPIVDDRFRDALDAMVDLVVIESAVRDGAGTIVDFQIDYMNPVDIDVAGRSRDDLTGRRLLDAYPALRGSDLFARFVQVAESGVRDRVEQVPYADEIDGETVTGFYAVQIAPFGDGIMVVSRDISDEQDHALHLQRANEQLSAAQQLAHIGIWEIDLVEQRVTFSSELRSLFGLSADEPVPDFETVINTLIHPDDRDLLASIVLAAPTSGSPFTVEARVRPVRGGERTLVVFGQVELDDQGAPARLWGTAQDVTELRRAQKALYRSTERLEQERGLVARLQEIIRPELPLLPEIELAAVYLPAGDAALVGGDWYDAFLLDDGRIMLTVGDVAGSGLPAASTMTQLRNALRGAAFARLDTSETLRSLNRLVASTTENVMATCLCAVYEPATTTFEFTTAGHPPPLVVEPGAPGRFLEVTPAPPLGFPAKRYVGHTVVLPAGTTVVLYTDGLVEARGLPIDEGLARLRRTVDEHIDLPLQELCEAVSLSMFEDRERRDDVCIVIGRTASPRDGGLAMSRREG